MDRWMRRVARLLGTLIGVVSGVVALQMIRLRRLQFLPNHPGFYVSHVVEPAGGDDRPPLRMVVFGDSTTAGVGVDRAEDSLPYRTAQHVADTHRRRIFVVSYGWAGARVADVRHDQVPRAMRPLRTTEADPFLLGADFVAVVIGANDATHRTPPWRFRSDLRASLEAIRTAAPYAPAVLAGIPRFRGALRQVEPLIWITDTFARALRPIGRAEAARAGIAYADLAREVPRRTTGRRDLLSADAFHPSAAGYAAWAEVIAEALLAGPDEPTARGAANPEPAGV